MKSMVEKRNIHKHFDICMAWAPNIEVKLLQHNSLVESHVMVGGNFGIRRRMEGNKKSA
jgi:hypothetical protein